MQKDWTKVDIERRGTILRYFNPVGAHESGQIGEDPIGIPNNLMPFIAQVANGRRDHLNIFGSDYDTLDGTGARDYIHIVDLADAHIKALHCQPNLDTFEVLNIGNGEGINVLELVNSFQHATGVSIKYHLCPRRDGDLPAFWANASLAFERLAWKPQFTIDQMCKDTWHWQKNNTTGYKPDS
jgi:UDP-glucose 4-epimerase